MFELVERHLKANRPIQVRQTTLHQVATRNQYRDQYKKAMY